MDRICLITSAHISYNPRLIKEADALQEAGYEVCVTAINAEPSKARLDEELMVNRRWRLQTVNVRRNSMRGRLRWLWASTRQRRHLRFLSNGLACNGIDVAFSRYAPELAKLAKQYTADLYLAHNLQALPAAAWAAQYHGARLGFDAEDFHRGEFTPAEEQSVFARLTRTIEENYLRRCDHLTAASEGIAEEYAAVLSVRRPVVILNCFPRAHRKGCTPHRELVTERRLPGLSLYWYSQVIGQDRGLDDALQALAIAGDGVVLHVRGRWADNYEGAFWSRACALGVSGRVAILPTAPPEQLIERAAQHDVGLALEPGNRKNNRIATSNKLLAYVLAGLAVAASDVPGQRAVVANLAEDALLFTPGNALALAEQLRRWRDDAEMLQRAKVRSRTLGETRFCWDVEKHRFLSAIQAL